MKTSTFLKSGHIPTLVAAFFYFDLCFAVWVLNGAMGPFITEQFHLNPGQTGFMISVPILSGALMRFPLGILSQYIGRKSAAIIEMSLICVGCLFGYLFVESYSDVIAMGVLLGVAGASFGIALSLGSGWFPKEYKGLAMGITGAGNSGTVIAVLCAPPLANLYGWRAVYGFASAMMLLPLLVMIIFAKEPPDRGDHAFKDYLECLWEKDGWVFNLVYVITFGGFIGLSTFLPTFYFSSFHVSKVEAGQLTMLATLVGSLFRVFGGYLSDRFGGIVTLQVVLLSAVGALLLLSLNQPLVITTLLFMLCFAAMGAGNGALFQLVPLRWPLTTAVVGSMIGEIGALGGSIIPNLMGQSLERTGSYSSGFLCFAALAAVVFVFVLKAKASWAGARWVDKNGRPVNDSDWSAAGSRRPVGV